MEFETSTEKLGFANHNFSE